MKSKEVKIKEAIERQKVYDSLSIKEKIEKLDKKLGTNIGAKKERAKLNGKNNE